MIDGIPISAEKCLYHWGKKWHYEKDVEEELSTNKKDYSKSHQSHSRNKSKSQFTCCNARALAQGCCSAKCHVWRGKLFSSSGMHGPFTGYVRTKKVTIILYLNANIKRLLCYFINVKISISFFINRENTLLRMVTTGFTQLIVRCATLQMEWR